MSTRLFLTVVLILYCSFSVRADEVDDAVAQAFLETEETTSEQSPFFGPTIVTSQGANPILDSQLKRLNEVFMTEPADEVANNERQLNDLEQLYDSDNVPDIDSDGDPKKESLKKRVLNEKIVSEVMSLERLVNEGKKLHRMIPEKEQKLQYLHSLLKGPEEVVENDILKNIITKPTTKTGITTTTSTSTSASTSASIAADKNKIEQTLQQKQELKDQEKAQLKLKLQLDIKKEEVKKEQAKVERRNAELKKEEIKKKEEEIKLDKLTAQGKDTNDVKSKIENEKIKIEEKKKLVEAEKAKLEVKKMEVNQLKNKLSEIKEIKKIESSKDHSSLTPTEIAKKEDLRMKVKEEVKKELAGDIKKVEVKKEEVKVEQKKTSEKKEEIKLEKSKLNVLKANTKEEVKEATKELKKEEEKVKQKKEIIKTEEQKLKSKQAEVDAAKSKAEAFKAKQRAEIKTATTQTEVKIAANAPKEAAVAAAQQAITDMFAVPNLQQLKDVSDKLSAMQTQVSNWMSAIKNGEELSNASNPPPTIQALNSFTQTVPLPCPNCQFEPVKTNTFHSPPMLTPRFRSLRHKIRKIQRPEEETLEETTAKAQALLRALEN